MIVEKEKTIAADFMQTRPASENLSKAFEITVVIARNGQDREARIPRFFGHGHEVFLRPVGRTVVHDVSQYDH